MTDTERDFEIVDCAFLQVPEREALSRIRSELSRLERRADGWCSTHDDRCHDRAVGAESELSGLQTENEQLRRAFESDTEAIEQAAENARLREALRQTAGYRGPCCGRAKEPMACMHDAARTALSPEETA